MLAWFIVRKPVYTGFRIHSNSNHMITTQSFEIAVILACQGMNEHHERDMEKPGVEWCATKYVANGFQLTSEDWQTISIMWFNPQL